MPLIEATGDLFANAPEKAILTHACNSQGRWGRGIALEFKSRYPIAYHNYNEACRSALPGEARIFPDKRIVGCLITSKNYNPPDDPVSIMFNTKKAVAAILKEAKRFYPGYEIHSNMFNSGLFEVPWSMTKSALIEALEESGDDIVWKAWQWNP